MSLIEALQEIEAGNRIEYRRKGTQDNWIDGTTCNWRYPHDNETWEFRRKAQKKLRPWSPEEVPVGALYKWHGHVSVILAVTNNSILRFVTKDGTIGGNYLYLGCLDKESLHSLDNGKTWLPCGVEE